MTSLPGRLLNCREFGGGELVEALNSGLATNRVLLSLVRPCWPCSTSCHLVTVQMIASWDLRLSYWTCLLHLEGFHSRFKKDGKCLLQAGKDF